jgi:hypothetical protein
MPLMPRTGRPIKGERPVRELAPFSARFTEETKARLLALAEVTGRPAYELLEQAVVDLVKGLPQETRRTVERRAKAAAKRR